MFDFADKQKHIWFAIVIVGLGLAGVLLPRLYDGYVRVAQAGDGVTTPITICDVGCDHTTINDALNAGGEDKLYQVESGFTPYDGSGDPINFPTSSFFSCASDDIVVASSSSQIFLGLNDDVTIVGCSFHNVQLQMSTNEGGYEDAPGVTISHNIFTTTTPSYIEAGAYTSNWTISNNVGLDGIYFASLSDDSSISNNTLHLTTTSYRSGITISGDNIDIINNTLSGYRTDGDNYGSMISSGYGLSNTLIATNTINFPVSLVTSSYGVNLINIFNDGGSDSSVTSTIIRGNRILMEYDDSQSMGSSNTVAAISVSATSTGQVDVDISHNTIVCDPHCNEMITIGGWEDEDSSATLTAQYNIFYNTELFAGDNMEDATAIKFNSGIDSPTVDEDYNVFYNFANAIEYSDTDQDIGSNSLESDPGLRVYDDDPTNDWMLAPYSNMFDINGSLDIGADSGSRSSGPFVIDADGTIDYSSVHATTTAVLSSATSSDTWNIYGGIYDGFSLASITGFTLSGQESGVVINAGSTNNPIRLSSVDNSTFSDMTLQNASSTVTSFSITMNPYSYNGQDYDAECDPCMEMWLDNEGEEDDMYLEVTENNQDITNVIDETPQTWNLALIKFEEMDEGEPEEFYATGYYDDNEFPNQAAVETFWENFMEGEEATTTVQFWEEDVFVYTNGAYVYTAPTGPTLMNGYNPGTPAIDKSLTYYNAGIYLSDSDSNSFVDVTSTGNTYNVHFTSSSDGNDITNSVLASALSYDVLADGTGDNNIKNTSFSATSSSITSTGDIDVYYKMRVLATSTSGGLEDVDFTVSYNDGTEIGTGETESDGYSGYSGFISAWTMDSTTTTDQTNGGYNPILVETSATSTYSANSVSENLNSVNQTYIVEMGSSPTAPTLSGGSIGSTTSTIEWIDNSDDETGFVILGSTDGSTYTITTTTAADVTSVAITDLIPNTAYYTKLGAFNSYGTSTYVSWGGDSQSTTDPAIPTSLTASANGQTSIIVTWDANSNPNTTVYDLRYDADSYTASITTTTDTSYTLTGLEVGTAYTFKVRAQYLSSSTQWTGYSDTASATTASASTGGGSAAPVAPSTPSTIAPVAVRVSVTPGIAQAVSVGNTVHTVTANPPATDGSVTMTIQSDPVTLTLASGEERLIDTNTDGMDDLFVRLDNVDGDKINMTLAAIENLEFSIDRALSDTDTRNVTLYFNSPDAVMMAISNTKDFKGVSYRPYASRMTWALTPGSGKKTVYVKFRTSQGGVRVVSDTITYKIGDVSTDVVIPVDQCPLTPGNVYKHARHPGVYYITDTCTKRSFRNAIIYFSYFRSWAEVFVTAEEILASVPRDHVRFMPRGPYYTPVDGTLIKTIDDPKVYLVTGKTRQWITSPTVFHNLGYEWSQVRHVATTLLETFEEGDAIR